MFPQSSICKSYLSPSKDKTKVNKGLVFQTVFQTQKLYLAIMVNIEFSWRVWIPYNVYLPCQWVLLFMRIFLYKRMLHAIKFINIKLWVRKYLGIKIFPCNLLSVVWTWRSLCWEFQLDFIKMKNSNLSLKQNDRV